MMRKGWRPVVLEIAGRCACGGRAYREAQGELVRVFCEDCGRDSRKDGALTLVEVEP